MEVGKTGTMQALALCGLLVLAPNIAIADPVNVNTADAATIAKALKGVGEKTAQAVVEYREAHGPFKSLEDLDMVKGIGEKVLENNKNDILFSD